MTPAQLEAADALWDEALSRPPEDDLQAVRDAEAEDRPARWWLRD